MKKAITSRSLVKEEEEMDIQAVAASSQAVDRGRAEVVGTIVADHFVQISMPGGTATTTSTRSRACRTACTYDGTVVLRRTSSEYARPRGIT
jgi:hypothetical protein